ncbi:hypothetical protein GCM10017779_69490 [Streptomyces capillispiralis]|nr:hypothetical protein GCM10017779_69490 [Streptomyces capillispiralis]
MTTACSQVRDMALVMSLSPPSEVSVGGSAPGPRRRAEAVDPSISLGRVGVRGTVAYCKPVNDGV